MEKNNGTPKAGAGLPKFDVWVYGMPGEDELEGAVREVKMMRRLREQGSDTLVSAAPATLKVLNVTPRRKSDTKSPDSTRRELAVEVELTEGVKRSVMNHFDDGLGLAAFKTGIKFTLVYWPFDKMARVSRSCDVLSKKLINLKKEEQPEGAEGANPPKA